MKLFNVCIFVCLLAACSGGKQGKEQVISVTIEPQRYFAEQIAGGRFTFNCVVPAGQDPEAYDPTPQQMVRIGESMAYLQVGNLGFEQAWLQTIRENNPQLTFFDLSQGVDLLRSEASGEGEAHEEHDGHDHAAEADAHHHHHAHAGGVDPHYWSSIEGAKMMAWNILNALIKLDNEHAAHYWVNYNRLIEEIEATDSKVYMTLSAVLSRAFIIYHPSLTYFAEDYNLTQLPLEVDGKEPSPAQLKELVDLARNYNVRVVFIQPEFNRQNAELIARETGCRLVTINPLNYHWSEEMIHIAEALAHE